MPDIEARQATTAVLAGGLGNQLFQLAAAIKVANGGPVMLLHGLGTTRNSCDASPDIFHFLKPRTVQFRSLSSGSLAHRFSALAAARLLSLSVSPSSESRLQRRLAEVVLSAGLNLEVADRYHCYGARSIGDDQLPAIRERQMLLVGYFQSWRIALADDVIQRVKEIRRAQESSWLEALRSRAEVEMPSVVHIRLGDYRKEPKFGFPGLNYLRSALALMKERGFLGRVWLFSDEPAIAYALLQEAKPGIDVRLVESPSGGESPATVLTAMTLGNSFILANSTFSWWGAALSQSVGAAICGPSPWFSQSRSQPRLVPRFWTAVDAHT